MVVLYVVKLIYCTYYLKFILLIITLSLSFFFPPRWLGLPSWLHLVLGCRTVMTLKLHPFALMVSDVPSG